MCGVWVDENDAKNDPHLIRTAATAVNIIFNILHTAFPTLDIYSKRIFG